MDNIKTDPFAKLSLNDDEKKEHSEKIENLDKNDLIEGYDISVNAKNHTNLTGAFEIFGNKYYKCPLEGINQDIKLFDKNRKEVKFDIRQVTIKPYDISITTCFNENNRDQLKNKLNVLFSVVCPKYEHFINYSVSNDIYITCDSKVEISHLETNEVKIRSIVATKKGNILKSNLIPDV